MRRLWPALMSASPSAPIDRHRQATPSARNSFGFGRAEALALLETATPRAQAFAERRRAARARLDQADRDEAARLLEELASYTLQEARPVCDAADWAEVRAGGEAANLAPMVDAWETRLRALSREGLVLWEGSQVSLSARGMLLSNGILEMFA